ncbi:putative quinate permease [Lasiodiplodia hormozganensis]|uniref:Quinate permease n=1 Tax=Lasiodiplodia hormozganensis TaxID=869390 RepID=A0AA40CTH2_9PEZI|nr:putative quinate permease [Lasiodiplodia hormozganensis]
MGAAGGWVSKDALATTPKEVLRFRIWITVLWASCCGGLHGVNTANISGIMSMKPFKEDFGTADMTTDQVTNWSGWAVSSMLLGQLVGVLISGPVGERWGRKACIWIAATSYLIGAILMAANFGSLPELIVGRVLSGLGSGFGMTIGAIYIAEVAPKAVRGAMSTLYNVNIMCGVAGSYWINYWALLHLPSSSPWQWRTPMILQVIPALCLFAGLAVFPETPRYLAMCGRLEDTKTALLNLRGIPEDHPYFVEEYEELVTKVYADQEAERGMKAFKTLFELCKTDESIRKRLIFVMIIQTLFIFSGGNSITYYAPTILKSMGLNSEQILLFTAIYGCVKVISVLLYAVFLSDRFGRRPLLLIGATLNLCCLIYLSAFLGLADTANSGPTVASWFAIVAICIFAVGYGFGWAPVFSLTTSEICPTRSRGAIVTVAFGYQNVLNFLISRFFPNMTVTMHAWGPFALFAAFTGVGVVWVWLAFPECKGRSMETMDQLFVRKWWQVGRLQGKEKGLGEAMMVADEEGEKDPEKMGPVANHVEKI